MNILINQEYWDIVLSTMNQQERKFVLTSKQIIEKMITTHHQDVYFARDYQYFRTLLGGSSLILLTDINDISWNPIALKHNHYSAPEWITSGVNVGTKLVEFMISGNGLINIPVTNITMLQQRCKAYIHSWFEHKNGTKSKLVNVI